MPTWTWGVACTICSYNSSYVCICVSLFARLQLCYVRKIENRWCKLAYYVGIIFVKIHSAEKYINEILYALFVKEYFFFYILFYSKSSASLKLPICP